MERKPRAIHNALLSKEPTFLGSSSCVRRTLALGPTVYGRDHRPNCTWVEGIIRARRGSVLYEVDVDGQTWVHHVTIFTPGGERTKIDELPDLGASFGNLKMCQYQSREDGLYKHSTSTLRLPTDSHDHNISFSLHPCASPSKELDQTRSKVAVPFQR
ncbi:unnamed protein product [Hymenolepis diminuta]|uniref:Uncharacterized protein n=1 Tax=Hymenolepis diminuta TaxID=6216 RepID=A0A564YFG4_HYMDI|nr:unnamed protein product [Hymenolepis diminuta]